MTYQPVEVARCPRCNSETVSHWETKAKEPKSETQLVGDVELSLRYPLARRCVACKNVFDPNNGSPLPRVLQ